MPSSICPSCGQQVYMVDEVRCMDRVWHKNCLKCNTCKKVLTVNNYRVSDKLPYCEQHCPDLKPTPVADMATRHAMETAKFQSQVQYRKDYEATKGDKTSVVDDIETRRAIQATRNTSPAAYRGDAERKQAMELERQKMLAQGFASPPRQEQQRTPGGMPPPQGTSNQPGQEGRPPLDAELPAGADPAMLLLIRKLLHIDDTDMPIVLRVDEAARPSPHRNVDASTSGMLCLDDAATSGVLEELVSSDGTTGAGHGAEPNVSASSRRSVSSGSSARSRKSAGKSQTGSGKNAKVQLQPQLANHSNSVEVNKLKKVQKGGQPAPGGHPQQDDCYRCLGPVSPLSRVDYRNKTWHRKCFMCQSCGSAFCAALRRERAVPTCVAPSLEARLRSTTGRGVPDIAEELQILREVDRALAAPDPKQVVRSPEAAETLGPLPAAAEPPSDLQPATAESYDRRPPKAGARAANAKVPSRVAGATGGVGDVRVVAGRPTGSAVPKAGGVRALGRPSPARPLSSNSAAQLRLQATAARRQALGAAAARSVTPRGGAAAAAAGSPRTPHKTTGAATSTPSGRALAAASRTVGAAAAAARGRAAAKPSTPTVTVDGDRNAKVRAGSAKSASRTAAPILQAGVKPAKPAAAASTAPAATLVDNAEAIAAATGDVASRHVAAPVRTATTPRGPAPSSVSRTAAASARLVKGGLARSAAAAATASRASPRSVARPQLRTPDPRSAAGTSAPQAALPSAVATIDKRTVSTAPPQDGRTALSSIQEAPATAAAASAPPKKTRPHQATVAALSGSVSRATPAKTRAPQASASVGRRNAPSKTPVKRLRAQTPSTPFRSPAQRRDVGRPRATPTSSVTSATDVARRLREETASPADMRGSDEATLGTSPGSLGDITNLSAYINALGDFGDRYLNSKLVDKALPTIAECSRESGSLGSGASLGGLELCPALPTMVALVDMQGRYPSFVKGDFVGKIKPAGGGFVVGTVLRTGERGFIKALHLADPMDLL